MSVEPPTLAPPREAGEPAPAPQPAPARSSLRALRPLVLRLHFYAGVFIAPFLLVAAVTGLLYAGSFQAEKFVYADELRVPVGKAELPISQQVAAARKAHPEGTISAVRPSPEAGATTRVLLTGVAGVAEGHTLAVFVDPYTGKVRGALESYGSTGALPLRTWIDELHRDLHLGETGRLYSELAASWLWVISGGGLLLWFGRRRTLRKLRGTRTGPGGRRRTLGLHGTVGAWAAAGLFFLSATGLTWSTYAGASIEDLRTALSQTTPSITTTVEEHAEHSSSTAGTEGMKGMAGMHGVHHAVTAYGAGAHLLAALLASWWLRRGEAAFWFLLRRARALAPGLAAWWRGRTGPVAPALGASALPPCPTPVRSLLLRHAVSRRGPPVPA